MNEPLVCPSCGRPSEVQSTRYGRRDECASCGLWSWGGKPLVDAETHQARQAAHVAFDEIWKRGFKKRTRAYQWLQRRLRMDEQPHMATMDVATAVRVRDLSLEYLRLKEVEAS